MSILETSTYISLQYISDIYDIKKLNFNLQEFITDFDDYTTPDYILLNVDRIIYNFFKSKRSYI
jgi:hypothetical protein